MPIELDTATIIALIIESLLFGIFTVLFSISTYVLVLNKRQNSRLNRPLVTVSVLMYILALAHLCISSQRAMIAFIKDRTVEGPIAYLSSSSNSLFLTKIVLYTAQTLIGDSFMAYRLYFVWSKDKRVLCAALTCLIACFVCGIITATSVGLAGPNTPIFTLRLKRWILSFFCLTFITNLSCSALIAYKIWSVEHRLDAVIVERRRSPVLSVIIESSVIYSMSLIILTGLFASGSWAQYIVLDSIVQLIGIVFSLIIVRIGLGLSEGAGLSMHTSRFTSRPGDAGFERGSQAPMRPLVVRIEESTTTDEMPAKTVSRTESRDV